LLILQRRNGSYYRQLANDAAAHGAPELPEDEGACLAYQV
jgi:hypothetical protein